MTMIDFKQATESLYDEMVRVRRDLHQHPELAFEEFRTASIVAEQLTQLGLEVQSGVGKTGVVGILEGAQEGMTVLVRADMDALPIHELNEVAYASTVAGKMHACGHDAHTAIALGVAKLFSQHRDQVHGRIKFVFQPAEEIAAGAKAMIDDGVLTAPRPDVTLGLHVWNSLPIGQFRLGSGAVMAGSKSFRIDIIGRGGHGASPHETADPIVVATQIVSAFQTIVSRNVDPIDTAVVSVTQIHAGDAHNVIPQTAMLSGTTRAFKSEVHHLIEQRMHAIVNHVASAFGCTATLTFSEGTLPVSNDPAVTQQVIGAVAPVTERFKTSVTPEITMGAEDVGLLMTDVPGAFWFIGSANAERGLDYGHHHPRFDIDETVLQIGAEVLARSVASYVCMNS